jgi:hypothetical protein
MVLFIAGSIYLPALFVRPHVNFLYSIGDDSYYGQWYAVDNGRLLKREPTSLYNSTPPGAPGDLYIYDVEAESSRQISEATAMALHLDSSTKSSDGFSVIYGRSSSSFFPFFYDSYTDYNSRYISGHGYSNRINVADAGRYSSFKFLGWILQ